MENPKANRHFVEGGIFLSSCYTQNDTQAIRIVCKEVNLPGLVRASSKLSLIKKPLDKSSRKLAFLCKQMAVWVVRINNI